MGNAPGKTDNDLFSDLQRAKENVEDALKRGDARALETLLVRYDALQQRWRTATQEHIEQIRNTAVASASACQEAAHARRPLRWASYAAFARSASSIVSQRSRPSRGAPGQA